MKKKFVSGSLQEDLDSLGIPGLDEAAMVRIATGNSISEAKSKDDEEEEDEEEGGDEGKKGKEKPKDDEDEDEDEDDEEEYDESVHDPIDGPFVTNELFDRIEELNLDEIDVDGIEALIEGLSKKKIPNNVVGIMERAEAVAKELSEVRKMIVWKGKRKKINVTKRITPEKIERRRMYRKKKARIKRREVKRSRRASAKMAASKTDRTRERLGLNNSFAAELGELLDETRAAVMTPRDEIVEHMCNIVDLIADEFEDDAVFEVFEEAMGVVLASQEAGRLDEDVMEEDVFMSEIRPVMTMIHKALEKIDGDQGNADSAICVKADAVDGGRVIRLGEES